MLELSNPFVMPESVMLRTQTSGNTQIGGCHMAVYEPYDDSSPMIGGCHMCDGSSFAPQYASGSFHREVAVLN